jgi:single-strand DNA-binding protein
MSLNQAQIIGYLGKDPEVRYLPSGEAVANFSIATSEKWKDKASGEPREETEWHRISVFGRLAEIVGEYLKKGSLVFVQGKLKTRKYTDGQGVERYSTEIRAETMKMLGGRDSHQGERSAPPAQRQAAPQRQQAPAAAPSGFDDMDDDIPF